MIGPDGQLDAEPATAEQISAVLDPNPGEASLGGSAPADQLAKERTKSLKVRLVGGLGADFAQLKAWLLDPVYGMAARYSASGGRWITFTGKHGPTPDFEIVNGGTDGCASGGGEIVRDSSYDVTLSIYMGPECGTGNSGYGLGGTGGAMAVLGLATPRRNAMHMAAHEVGHAIGFAHASAWSCSHPDAKDRCIINEYGNPLDFMGGDWRDDSTVSEITAMTANPAYVPADRIADVRSSTEIRIAGQWPATGFGTVLVPMQVTTEADQDPRHAVITTGVMTNGLALEWQPVPGDRYWDWDAQEYVDIEPSVGVAVRQIPFWFDHESGLTSPLWGRTRAFPDVLKAGQSLTIPKLVASTPFLETLTHAQWSDPSAFRITVLSADATGALVRIEMPKMAARVTRRIREDDDGGSGEGGSGSGGGGGQSQCRVKRGTAKANRLVGTARCDRILGLDGNDTILGRAGADKLNGGAGKDALFGGAGNDSLVGGPGNDRLFGGPGNDRLVGGPGNDVLNGGPGIDRLDGGLGNDRINARDGKRDIITCGRGRDTVIADRIDKVARDCEKVLRR